MFSGQHLRSTKGRGERVEAELLRGWDMLPVVSNRCQAAWVTPFCLAEEQQRDVSAHLWCSGPASPSSCSCCPSRNKSCSTL